MLVESTESGLLIRQRAVFRLHFVVFKNDRDSVLALAVNVGADAARIRGPQDRFHLFLRHAICHLIYVRLCDAFAGTGNADREHQDEHDTSKNDE